jgi:hypothetical protein
VTRCLLLLALTGCAHHPPATLAAPGEFVEQFALRASIPGAGEQVFAGLAAIRISPENASLEALSVAGPALFSVEASAESLQVSAPDPRMEAVLARIPFWRDLALLYLWQCEAGICELEGGRLIATDGDITYKGRGGGASLTRDGNVARIDDPRRGYSLTVVGSAH